MKVLTAKEMAQAQDWYFFTLDDFRPRRVGDDIKLRNNCIDLGYLRENGALFETKEDAINAGGAIKAFLVGNQMFLQSKQQHLSQLDKPREEVAQKQRNLQEETVACKEGHTQLEDDGQMHSGPHFSKNCFNKDCSFIIIVFKGFNANVMIIPDKSKSGRVERASGNWSKRKKKDGMFFGF